MNFLLKRFGLIVFGLLSILEAVLNTVLYVTFLDKIIPAFDFSFPFYFNYTNKVMKSQFIANQKKEIDG